MYPKQMYFITRLLLVAASVASLPVRLVHPIVVKRWENRQPSRFLFSIQPAAPPGTGAQAPAGRFVVRRFVVKICGRRFVVRQDWSFAKSGKLAAIFRSELPPVESVYASPASVALSRLSRFPRAPTPSNIAPCGLAPPPLLSSSDPAAASSLADASNRVLRGVRHSRLM
jgi:hypothetical protein